MSKAEDIAKAIYIRCFDDEFKYPEVLNALRICAEENAETIEQLQDKVEMLDFFYEGNGFKRRGLNNFIQIAEYIDKLEKQLEKMKCCENCAFFQR